MVFLSKPAILADLLFTCQLFIFPSVGIDNNAAVAFSKSVSPHFTSIIIYPILEAGAVKVSSG